MPSALRRALPAGSLKRPSRGEGELQIEWDGCIRIGLLCFWLLGCGQFIPLLLGQRQHDFKYDLCATNHQVGDQLVDRVAGFVIVIRLAGSKEQGGDTDLFKARVIGAVAGQVLNDRRQDRLRAIGDQLGRWQVELTS